MQTVEIETLLFKFEIGFCLGGKAGGLKLSVEINLPFGGKIGAELELSEPSSMDRRLSLEADLLLEDSDLLLLDDSLFLLIQESVLSEFLAISLRNFSMPALTLEA